MEETELVTVARDASEDDVGSEPDGTLVVSDAALTVMRQHRLGHCDAHAVPRTRP